MLCPFCKEEIRDGAIKCKHCGSMLNVDATDERRRSPILGKVLMVIGGLIFSIFALVVVLGIVNIFKGTVQPGGYVLLCVLAIIAFGGYLLARYGRKLNGFTTVLVKSEQYAAETGTNGNNDTINATADHVTQSDDSLNTETTSNERNQYSNVKMSVIDAKLIFTQFIFILLCVAIMYFFTGKSIYSVVPFLLILFFILKISANWSGCVYDQSQNTLSFPGGGKQASDFIEYLTPMFWVQGIKRYSVNVDQIVTIEMDYSESILSSMSDKGKPFYNYYLVILGSFGSYKIGFESETKRDELYALIRNVNQMGIPYIRAEGSGSVI